MLKPSVLRTASQTDMFFKDKRYRKWFWRKYGSLFAVVGKVVTGDLLV